MARKHGTLHTLIPKFDPSNLYVYFNDLLVPTDHKGIDKIKQSLHKTAQGYYAQLVNELAISPDSSETINNAIEFLGQAAENERRKEIQVIEKYIDYVYNQLPNSLKGNNTYNHTSAQDLINQLKTFSDSFAKGSTGYNTQIDIQHFYQSLTLCLNVIRDDINEFKKTLMRISDSNRKKMSSLASRSWLYRYESDMEGLFKNLIGIATKQSADSFASTMRTLVFDYFADPSKNYLSNINVRDHFPALMAGMLADFENYVSHQTNYDQLLDKSLSNSLGPMFEQYLEQGDTLFLQRLQDFLESENNQDSTFTQALKRFEQNVGIKFEIDNEKEKSERERAIAKQLKDTRSANAKERNYIKKRLRELGQAAFAQSFKYMTWTPRTNGSHGTIYEAVEDIIGNSLHAEGRGATDNIYILGTFKGEIHDREYDDLVTDAAYNIAKEITKSSINERVDRFQNTAEPLDKINDNIATISEELNDQLIKLNKIDEATDKLFVFHESLKLYSSMEWDIDSNGVRKRQSQSFHGRNMLALNMLDSLYTLENVGDLKLPDKNTLYGLMMNLNSESVMGNQENVVENYLAIFAGLLMFSDARNMAIEAAKDTQKQIISHTSQLHIYLLNGVYIPGSMVLTTVYEAIRHAYQTISLSNGISVNIKTEAAAESVRKYINSRKEGTPYSRDDWDIKADEIASKIDIEIKFLSGFVSFIQALNKQF